MNSFTVFIYLNLLDVVSTLAVLHYGGVEANPVTAWVLTLGRSKALALLAEKALFLPVSWLALKWAVKVGLNRNTILHTWNVAYMFLVVWNLQNLI